MRHSGSELIFALCDIQTIEIVIITKNDPPIFEEELAQDVIEIITVFSARLSLNDLSEDKEIIRKSMCYPTMFQTKPCGTR